MKYIIQTLTTQNENSKNVDGCDFGELHVSKTEINWTIARYHFLKMYLLVTGI